MFGGLGGLLGRKPFDNETQAQQPAAPAWSLGGDLQSPQTAQPSFQPQVRTPQQINQAPFKMFEDGTFQGDPRQYGYRNPGYKFYEDNSFSAPQTPIISFEELLRRR